MFDDRFPFPMQVALNLYAPQQTEDRPFPLSAPREQAAKAPEKASPAGQTPKAAQDADPEDEKKEGGSRAEAAL